MTPSLPRRPVAENAADPVTISIIISSYNAREVLADCLDSIYRNPPGDPYEIIAVDDASSDGTSEMVRTRYADVTLLTNERNLHYTNSNNRALGQVRGAYVYLLNNDTIVLPQAIDAMLAFLRSHPDAGAVGSKLLNADGTVQWSVKSLPDLGSALFGGRGLVTRLFPGNRYTRKRFLHHGRDAAEPFIAGYLSGASKMMPRNVMDQVGNLEPRLFYHVDADYCKRIVDAGFNCYYLPSAAVIHLNHKGGTMVTARLRLQSLFSFHRDCYIYYVKHMSKTARGPMRFAVLAGLAVSLVTRFAVQMGGELVAGAPWRKLAPASNPHPMGKPD